MEKTEPKMMHRTPPERIVLCMKWGTLFPADYVNVLFRACRAKASRGRSASSATDHAKGLAPGIELMAIPDVGLRPEQWYTPGVWPRLRLTVRSGWLCGRALFIDLDMAVVGRLDEFFDLPGDYNCLGVGPGWAPGAAPDALRTVGTRLRLHIGAQAGLRAPSWPTGPPPPAPARSRISLCKRTRHRLLALRADVISFKRHLAHRFGPASPLRLAAAPPALNGIVAFHGEPRPACVF